MDNLSDKQIAEQLRQEFKQDQVKKTNFPTETVALPSKGLIYAADSALAQGSIEMKYMTAKEEDILTSVNLIKQGVVLDRLFQSLIVSKINYNDLIVGDKNAIMIAARILGYGKDYDFKYTCPECDHENEVSVDLTTLETKEFNPEGMVNANENRFVYTLPTSKRELEFKLLTHGDEKKIDEAVKGSRKLYKRSGVTPELTTRLKQQILSVDGTTDRKFISDFVDNEFFAVDSRAFRQHVKELTPDVNFNFDFMCSNCGYESTDIGLPIDLNFFWPGA